LTGVHHTQELLEGLRGHAGRSQYHLSQRTVDSDSSPTIIRWTARWAPHR